MQVPQNNIQKSPGDFWASGLDDAVVEVGGAALIVPSISRSDAIKESQDIPP